MGEEKGEQSKELERLEQAAEEASEPHEIQKTAESQPERTVMADVQAASAPSAALRLSASRS